MHFCTEHPCPEEEREFASVFKNDFTTSYTDMPTEQKPHIPVVGEICTLGGLEFEVIETNGTVFSTSRVDLYTHLIQKWAVKDADSFTWPKPKAVWTEDMRKEIVDHFNNNEVNHNQYALGVQDVLNYIRSRIGEGK